MARESNILDDATRPPAKSGVPQDEGQSGGDERRQRRARHRWTAPGWRTRRQGGVEDDPQFPPPPPSETSRAGLTEERF
jgi:hypothetical protein